MEADFIPSFAGESIADMRLGRGHVLEPVVLPMATGGDGGLTYTLTPELPDGLQFDSATRTLSGVPKELGGPWTYAYSATDSDPIGPDAASLSFTLEVVILAEDKAVLNDILAAQGRALLTGATSAIGRRFGAGSSASTALTQGEALNMLSGWVANAYTQYGAPGTAGGMPWGTGHFGAGAQPRAAAMKHSSPGGLAPRGPSSAGSMARRSGLRHLLQGRSYTLTPKSKLNRPSQRLLGWTVWSAADFQRFSGATGANEYDGSMFSLYVGGDMQLGANWLAGAAVSRNSSSVDYTVMTRSGQMETGLFSVYPYVHGRMGSGMELWAIGGLGMGEAEDLSSHAGAEAESGDLSMTMAAAGLRQPLRQLRGLDFAIVGGAGLLSLSTKEGLRAVDGLSASVTQVRLGVELARSTTAMAPYLRLALRHDGGGSDGGAGVEVVGGARYSGALIDFEAQARWLAAHSAANYQEVGGMARLLIKPRADGTGLSMSLKPGWGEANGGALLRGNNTLLGEAEFRALQPAGLEPGPQPLVMHNDLGYGVALGGGLLTLGARQFRFGKRARESFGLAWESADLDPASSSARDLALRLDYRRPNLGIRGGFRVEMRYSLRL